MRIKYYLANDDGDPLFETSAMPVLPVGEVIRIRRYGVARHDRYRILAYSFHVEFQHDSATPLSEFAECTVIEDEDLPDFDLS